MLNSWRRFCTWMATELDPGPISPTMGFFPCISKLPASAVHLPWFSSSSLDTSVSRMNSILCSSATAECQHESLVGEKKWVHNCLGGHCRKKRWKPYREEKPVRSVFSLLPMSLKFSKFSLGSCEGSAV